jgi:hypothetical protein
MIDSMPHDKERMRSSRADFYGRYTCDRALRARNTAAKDPSVRSAREPSIAICLTSYNRIECAKVNQEIFKLNFRTPFLLVHACSGAQKERYLEDAFIWCAPGSLNAGGIDLIQRSLELACDRFAPDYLVHLEADTWILDEQVILRFVREMERNPRLLLATCAWSSVSGWRRARRAIRELVRRPSALLRHQFDIVDFAAQFFILRNDPAVVRCILDMRPDEKRRAERQLYDAYVKRFGLDSVLRMREREPVHPHNRQSCETLALYCHHWPASGTAEPPSPDEARGERPDRIGKREALLRYPQITRGAAIQRLLNATSFEYYNPGASRW